MASAAIRERGGSGRLAQFVFLRSSAGLLVILVAISIAFLVIRHVPGGSDVSSVLGIKNLTAEQKAVATQQMGLDKPLIVQLGIYLSQLAQGDLGISYVQRQSVLTLLTPQVISTLQLTTVALGLAALISITAVLLTAGRRKLIETPARSAEVVFASLPQFWLGLMLLLVFAITLKWFPVAGSSIVLPALTLALPLSAFLSQLTRQSFEDALAQPFIVSARARGVSDFGVRSRHALRHALLPALASSGQAVGWLLGGSVVIEIIYARQGVGRVMLDAMSSRDLPLILGVVLFVAVAYVLINIVVDVLHKALDPRVAHR